MSERNTEGHPYSELIEEGPRKPIKIPIRDWIVERMKNCLRIAALKQSRTDRDGWWIDDGEYFKEALEAIDALTQAQASLAAARAQALREAADIVHERDGECPSERGP